MKRKIENTPYRCVFVSKVLLMFSVRFLRLFVSLSIRQKICETLSGGVLPPLFLQKYAVNGLIA